LRLYHSGAYAARLSCRLVFSAYSWGARQPPLAYEAAISIVRTPSLSVREDDYLKVRCSDLKSSPRSASRVYGRQALSTYFSAPRVLAMDDLVAVPVERRCRDDGKDSAAEKGNSDKKPATGFAGRSRSEFAIDLLQLQSQAQAPGDGQKPTLHCLSDLVFFRVAELTADPPGEAVGVGAGEKAPPVPVPVRVPAMVVQRGGTALLQRGAVQSPVPDPGACHPFQCEALAVAPGAAPWDALVEVRLLLPPPPPPVDPEAVGELVRMLRPLAWSAAASPLLARAALLLYGPAGLDKRALVRTAAQRIGCHCHHVRTRTLLRGTDVGTTAAFRAVLEEAKEAAPCVLHLDGVTAAYNLSSRRHGSSEATKENRLAAAVRLCLDELGVRQQEGGAQTFPVVVVGSCDVIDDLAEPIRRCFTHELKLKGYPGPALRQQVRQLVCFYFTDASNDPGCARRSSSICWTAFLTSLI
jgi:hypothetical protein